MIGLTGPRGPAGPSEILPTDVYLRIGLLTTGISIAQCDVVPPADTVLGVGFIVNPALGNNSEPRLSHPTNGDIAWRAQANSGTPITAVALCFDN